MGHDRPAKSGGSAPGNFGVRRARAEIIGRSGVLFALVLVVGGSVLAFALTSSTALRVSLPPQIEVGPGVTTTTTTTTTTTIPFFPTTTTATSVPPTTATSEPRSTTTLPATAGDKKTTVVKSYPTVRIEDNSGKQIDGEGTKKVTSASDS